MATSSAAPVTAGGKGKAMLPDSIFRQMLAKLSDKQLRNLEEKLSNRPWKMSSACSGSGMAEVSWVYLHKMFSLPAHVAFSCENVKWKQRFLEAVLHDKIKLVPGCIFADLCRLHRGVARCEVHNCDCDVPKKSQIFVCGFSCKDFSRKNSSISKQQRQNILSAHGGSSGSTFSGVIGHVHQARPMTVLLENVDGILQPHCAENLDYLWKSLSEVGYAGASKVFKTKEYGIPQERTRAFFLVLDCAALGYSAAEARNKAFEALEFAETFQVEALPLRKFLLSSDDAKVRGELERRQQSALGDSSATWVDMHKEFFKSKGISYQHIKPSRDLSQNEWFSMLPMREKECLCWGLSRPLKEAATVLTCIDVTQRIDRQICSWDFHLPTLTPGSKLWLASCDADDRKENSNPKRFLTGWEALQAQGYPMAWLQGLEFSDPQMADLAGNAFTSTILLALEMSIVINIDPRATTENPAPMDTMQSMILNVGLLDD